MKIAAITLLCVLLGGCILWLWRTMKDTDSVLGRSWRLVFTFWITSIATSAVLAPVVAAPETSGLEPWVFLPAALITPLAAYAASGVIARLARPVSAVASARPTSPGIRLRSHQVVAGKYLVVHGLCVMMVVGSALLIMGGFRGVVPMITIAAYLLAVPLGGIHWARTFVDLHSDGVRVARGALRALGVWLPAEEIGSIEVVQTPTGKAMGYCRLRITMLDLRVVESPPLAHPARVIEELRLSSVGQPVLRG